jgi:DNA invertase Pin-like site-specific DNA recombinase
MARPASPFISYLRVSTTRQSDSGLGLEAQREAVEAFSKSRGSPVLAEYLEVESGACNDRPRLAAALAHAKRAGATLVIAKLDRLARSVATISSLMEAGVDFVACDMPEANRFVLHIMAAVAEYEREAISARTKAALAAAKARGVVLGAHGRVLGAQARAEAQTFALTCRADLQAVTAGGARTLHEIAAGLNARGCRSREGGPWAVSSTAKLVQRLQATL